MGRGKGDVKTPGKNADVIYGFVTGTSDLVTHSQQKTARGQIVVLSGVHRAHATQ